MADVSFAAWSFMPNVRGCNLGLSVMITLFSALSTAIRSVDESMERHSAGGLGSSFR